MSGRNRFASRNATLLAAVSDVSNGIQHTNHILAATPVNPGTLVTSPVGRMPSIVIIVSICPLAYLKNDTSKLHEIYRMYYL